MLGVGLGSQPTTECGIFGSYQCLELDGNSDLVRLPVDTLGPNIKTDSGTLSCWVDIRDNDGATTQNIIRIADNSSNNNVGLQFHRANTEFRAIYRMNGVYKEATYDETGYDVAAYAAQGWIHLAMTWTHDGGSTGAVKIYKNGDLQDTVAQAEAFPEADAIDIIHIGANDAGTGGFADGFIDQVAIYDEVLSDGEITAIYNEGTMRDLTTFHTHYSPRGLIAYYQFEGNALDSSGNGHHGTLIGTAGFNTSQP